MLAIIHERPTLLCDICGYGVKLSTGEILASESSGPAHLPRALTVCGEACGIMAEHKLEVKPIIRQPVRAVLESLLRE